MSIKPRRNYFLFTDKPRLDHAGFKISPCSPRPPQFGHEFVMEEWVDEANEPNNTESFNPPSKPRNRGGRPKGSKNKVQADPVEVRPRGRPRGTGPKQLARASAGDVNTVQKQPVGRPPKLAPAKQTEVRLGKRAPGTVNTNPLHAIFNPQPVATSGRSQNTISAPAANTITDSDSPVVDEGQPDGEDDGTDGGGRRGQ
ncbi:hypothetical protein DFH06DRAFT_1122977 [Mycena polygramma]|nr:hypothetical protein DFH06DRAFT_1122977 [Mycena polygramma]